MLDKAIIAGKEHRKPYRGGKAIDKTCRNHGGCSWCRSNRTISRAQLEKTEQELRDFRRGKVPDAEDDPVIFSSILY